MREKINKLEKLISTFHSNIKQYKSSAYDEANTRVDFIDKFFELLEWDVRNTQGFSEDFREVVREDTVYIAGKPKAPDYSFRQGGRRLFFVEAKKPMVDIKEALEPAFQLRRYAYTAKLPLSILTDFEEFAIYDTRIKPNQKDKASVARIFYCKYDEYLSPNKTDHEKTNLEYINAIFSKGEILKGSFKNFIDDTKRKSGTSEVDKEFLKLIESWRTDLAKNIAIRNKDLDVYNLNTAVQKIIDRIIFIRIAEDRHMEEYGALLALSREEDIYRRLDEFFQKADEKYNSGLFLIFDWISNLVIDNKVLSTIIQELYPPGCPYEFSVLPIEILGNIYEQFLGKTIRLTPSHQAKVEEKPEVRKAGGVYYTPQYIVDYIVQNTVGEMLRRAQQPNKIEKIRILDPACGSGSFLVGAYNYLLNFHIAYYSKPANLKKAMKGGKIYRFSENTFRLSIQEKQRILLNNIYGVDIDHQAVEVTKLSLLLKLMENEQVESSGELFKHSDLKLLPDLSDNIRCGNSLIGSDFYADKELSLFGKEEMRKVNAFDWDKEFPEIFPSAALREHTGTARESKGKTDRSVSGAEPTGWGFDCVIGNPPYGAELLGDEKKYLAKYDSYEYQLNSFVLFMEKGGKFLKENGKLSYIVPAVFLAQHFFSNIRNIILNKYMLKKILLLNYKVFQNADTGDTCIFVLDKSFDKKNSSMFFSAIKNIDEFQNISYKSKKIKDFKNNPRHDINIFLEKGILDSIALISVPLIKVANAVMGIKPYQTGKGKPKQTRIIVTERPFDSNKKINVSYKQYLIGKDINRYIINPVEIRFIKYGEWLAEPRNGAPFDREKIVMRQTSDCIRACIDKKSYFNLNNVYNIELLEKKYHLNYLLGIFNSRLMVYIYQKIVPEKGRLFAEIKKVNLNKLPIRTIDTSIPSEKAQHDKMVSLVDQMLSVQKELHSAKTDPDKDIIQKKIDLLDRQIDTLVYELYGLTDEEIRIVEGG